MKASDTAEGSFAISKDNPIVLILCDRPVPAREMGLLTREILQLGTHQPVLVVTTPTVERQIPEDVLNKVRTVRLYQGGEEFASLRALASGEIMNLRHWWRVIVDLPDRLMWYLKTSIDEVSNKYSNSEWAVFWNFLSQIRQTHKRAFHIFRELSPSVLIVSGDRGSAQEAAFISVARKQGVPSLIVPNAVGSKEVLLQVRKDRMEFQVLKPPSRILKFIIWKFLSRQVCEDPSIGPCLQMRLGVLFARIFTGTLPPNPWVIGGGMADSLCAFGPSHKKRAVADGVLEKKIHITGLASLDSLWRRYQERDILRAELAQQHKIDPDKIWIILAVPALYEHKMRSWENQQKDSVELLQALDYPESELILSLHPRCKRESYLDLMTGKSAVLSDRPLAEILPVADVFVANISSIVNWAVLLKIPTILIDHYDLDYQMYEHIEGMLLTKSIDALRQTSGHLVADASARSEISERLRDEQENIAIFDGQSTKRILAVIDTLMRS